MSVSPLRLALGSGAGFALGAVAGVVGNNLAQGLWWRVGFAVLVVLGSVVSGWLTYRGASAPAAPSHRDNNEVHHVENSGSGTSLGINYGNASGSGAPPGGGQP